jgi:competence protein ComEA
MQPAERRALLLLLGLAIAGHAVRAVVEAPNQAPGEVELVRTLPAQSPLAHKESTMALARPLRPGEKIDIDRAGPTEIARLPRVGPGLAKRIVADRESRGPFGSLQGLDRVAGVGVTLLAAISGHATFSGSNNNLTSGLGPRSVAGCHGGSMSRRVGGLQDRRIPARWPAEPSSVTTLPEPSDRRPTGLAAGDWIEACGGHREGTGRSTGPFHLSMPSPESPASNLPWSRGYAKGCRCRSS